MPASPSSELPGSARRALSTAHGDHPHAPGGEPRPKSEAAGQLRRPRSAGGINPLPSLLRAAALDAGNRAMRDAGRATWSEDDYDLAADTLDRLIDACYGTGPEGRCRFGYAEAMERARLLTVYTRDFFGVFNRAWDEYVASFGKPAQ